MKTLNSFDDDGLNSKRPDRLPMLNPIAWPNDYVLLEWLWTKPATHIARELGCDPSSIRARAKSRQLPRPKVGYWPKKRAGLKVEIPEQVKSLITKLASAECPPPNESRRRYPNRRRWRRVRWPSDLDFLEQIWSLPFTHIAKALGCCHQAVQSRAKQLSFPTPGEGFWQRKTAGIHMPIPDAVKALIEELKRKRI